MSLYPQSALIALPAVYYPHTRMLTSFFLYWSYNWGSEWGISTVNIMWKCGNVEGNYI